MLMRFWTIVCIVIGVGTCFTPSTSTAQDGTSLVTPKCDSHRIIILPSGAAVAQICTIVRKANIIAVPPLTVNSARDRDLVGLDHDRSSPAYRRQSLPTIPVSSPQSLSQHPPIRRLPPVNQDRQLLSRRVAEIDRLRDRALERGDISMLQRADAMEREAKSMHFRWLQHATPTARH